MSLAAVVSASAVPSRSDPGRATSRAATSQPFCGIGESLTPTESLTVVGAASGARRSCARPNADILDASSTQSDQGWAQFKDANTLIVSQNDGTQQEVHVDKV